MPKSPAKELTVLFSNWKVGDSIKTTGGFDDVYPVPGPVIEIEVTIPELIDVDAVAF